MLRMNLRLSVLLMLTLPYGWIQGMQGTPLSVIDLDLLDSDNELLEEQEVFMIECRGQSLSHKQHALNDKSMKLCKYFLYITLVIFWT